MLIITTLTPIFQGTINFNSLLQDNFGFSTMNVGNEVRMNDYPIRLSGVSHDGISKGVCFLHLHHYWLHLQLHFHS